MEENSILRDRVQITWDINRKCNYLCPHCWYYKKWDEEEKSTLHLPAERWINIWENICNRYGRIYVVICGGEPFLYPSFVEIIEKISYDNFLSIMTNGTAISDIFFKKVKPKNVALAISFYPYLLDAASTAKFMDTVRRLKENNFEIDIKYIAYPPQFDYDKIKMYRDKLKMLGAKNFDVTTYWGEYNGSVYPDAYSEEDKEFMIEHSDYKPPFNLSAKIENSKGKLCWAGGRYVLITPRGDVVRCGASGIVIGSILDDNLRLSEVPQPCPIDFCKCGEHTRNE